LKSDVIIGSYEKFDYRSKGVRKFKCPVSTVDFAAEPALWRIIFRSSEIAGLKFTEFQMAEDQIYLMSYFKNQKIVYSTGEIIYRYTINREGQISTRISSRKELDNAINYLLSKKALIESDFGKYIFGKLNISLGARGLRRLFSKKYSSKRIFLLLNSKVSRITRKDFDSSFELVWTING
jgi:hypothetical protein